MGAGLPATSKPYGWRGGGAAEYRRALPGLKKTC